MRSRSPATVSTPPRTPRRNADPIYRRNGNYHEGDDEAFWTPSVSSRSILTPPSSVGISDQNDPLETVVLAPFSPSEVRSNSTYISGPETASSSPGSGCTNPEDDYGIDSDRHGIDPNEHGIDSNEYGIDSHEYNVGSDGYGIDSHEYNVGSDGYGIDPNEHGIDSNKYGIDSHEYNVDSDGYGIDPNVHGIDSHEYGIDSHEYGIDSHEYNVDSDGYGIDPNVHGIDSNEYGIDSHGYNVDSDGYGINPNVHGIDSNEYGINSHEYDINSEEHGIESDEDGFKFDEEASSNASPIASAKTAASLSNSETELPDEPYYNESFQLAFNRGTQTAQCIANILDQSPRQENTIIKLRDEALSLSKYSCPVTRLIGVIGHSGQGKSSLINSLLDIQDLAITGENGKAVTAFVIEYKHKKNGQLSKFAIDATCLTAAEINEQLSELYKDYCLPFLDSRNEMNAIEFQAAEERSEVAKCVFEAAFAKIEGFDVQALKSMPTALSWLQEHALSFKWPVGMKDGQWSCAAETTDQCHDLISPFVKQGLWPFIKKMTIYLDARILSCGIVLADLPGYHDVNFARVRAAHKYQSTCDELFIVADIKRAVDNPIIGEVIKERNPSAPGIGEVYNPNVTIICTHSADVSVESKSLQALIDFRKLERAKSEIERVDNKRYKTNKEARSAFAEAELALKWLFVQARNEQVKLDLQKAYSKDFEHGNLPVFCVDNCAYFKQDSLGALSMSGIPVLRRYSLSLPGKALFKAVNLYLESHIPSMIASLEIWLEAGKSTKTFCLSGEVDLEDWFSAFEEGVEGFKDSSLKMFRKSISGPLQTHQQKIRGDALGTWSSWNGMHHSSYRAFIRHYGTHSTKAEGYRCWNSELVASINARTASKWASLDAFTTVKLEELCSLADSEFEGITKELKVGGAPVSLLRSLTNRRRQVEAVLEDRTARFMNELRKIKQDATSGYPSSYMAAYMIPAYKECQPDYGTGVTERCRQRLGTHIGRPDFTSAQLKGIYDDLYEIVEDAAANISDQVLDIISLIKADLKRIESPSKTLMKTQPMYVKRLEGVLQYSKDSKADIDRMATEARTEARKRGYIV